MNRRPNPQMYRILLIGGDISHLSNCANLLTQAGYDPDLVCKLDDAIRRVSMPRYHLAIVSDSLSTDEQLTLRKHLRRVRPLLPVLLQTPAHRRTAVFLAAVDHALRPRDRSTPDLAPALFPDPKSLSS
jgi:DNA-binding NtrC family response regulator